MGIEHQQAASGLHNMIQHTPTIMSGQFRQAQYLRYLWGRPDQSSR